VWFAVRADQVVAAKSLCDEVLGTQPWAKITSILELVASRAIDFSIFFSFD
jgi:hypothetical protein